MLHKPPEETKETPEYCFDFNEVIAAFLKQQLVPFEEYFNEFLLHPELARAEVLAGRMEKRSEEKEAYQLWLTEHKKAPESSKERQVTQLLQTAIITPKEQRSIYRYWKAAGEQEHKKEPVKALELYVKGVRAGDEDCLIELGNRYRKSNSGVPQDFQKSCICARYAFGFKFTRSALLDKTNIGAGLDDDPTAANAMGRALTQKLSSPKNALSPIEPLDLFSQFHFAIFWTLSRRGDFEWSKRFSEYFISQGERLKIAFGPTRAAGATLGNACVAQQAIENLNSVAQSNPAQFTALLTAEPDIDTLWPILERILDPKLHHHILTPLRLPEFCALAEAAPRLPADLIFIVANYLHPAANTATREILRRHMFIAAPLNLKAEIPLLDSSFEAIMKAISENNRGKIIEKFSQWLTFVARYLALLQPSWGLLPATRKAIAHFKALRTMVDAAFNQVRNPEFQRKLAEGGATELNSVIKTLSVIPTLPHCPPKLQRQMQDLENTLKKVFLSGKTLQSG